MAKSKRDTGGRVRVVGVVLSPYARPGEVGEVDGDDPVVQRYLSQGVLVREDDIEQDDDNGGEREPAPAQQGEPGQATKDDGQ